MAESDGDAIQLFLSELPRILSFKIGGPPPIRRIPERRYRNHIYVTQEFGGFGIIRAPGDFLCLGIRTCEPALYEPGTVAVTCAECLRSVRRIFRQRMKWRERRAVPG